MRLALAPTLEYRIHARKASTTTQMIRRVRLARSCWGLLPPPEPPRSNPGSPPRRCRFLFSLSAIDDPSSHGGVERPGGRGRGRSGQRGRRARDLGGRPHGRAVDPVPAGGSGPGRDPGRARRPRRVLHHEPPARRPPGGRDRRRRRALGGRTEAAAIMLALPLYAVAALTFRPSTGDVGRIPYALALVPIFVAAVWVGVLAFRRVARGPAHGDPDVARREVVRAMWVGGAGFLLGWANIGRAVFRRPDPGKTRLAVRGPVSPAARPSAAPGDAPFARIPGLTPEITPNGRFYTVNEELFPPDVDPETWRLQIGGLVERPFRLSYRQLIAMPAVEQFLTLECVSNKIGGPLISTAKWTGVRLRDLLDRAGVRAGAVEVVSRSVDGFADSVPIDDALAPPRSSPSA